MLPDGVELAFCPTGPGGGIDNSCSPHKAGADYVSKASADSATKRANKRSDEAVSVEQHRAARDSHENAARLHRATRYPDESQAVFHDVQAARHGARLGIPGSKTNPIRVGDDIKLAAQLLAEDKHVQLDQPEQVSTLVSELRNLVLEAAASGEEAPNIDLCKVSVSNTNLFCQDSVGIPRVEMPQIKGTPIPGTYASTFKKDDNGEVNLAKD